MFTFENQTFTNEAVIIDGYCFKNCRFSHCNLIFSSAEDFEFAGVAFENCRWELRGLAAKTADFLHQLYTRDAAEAERLFDAIRKGPRKAPSPH